MKVSELVAKSAAQESENVKYFSSMNHYQRSKKISGFMSKFINSNVKCCTNPSRIPIASTTWNRGSIFEEVHLVVLGIL